MSCVGHDDLFRPSAERVRSGLAGELAAAYRDHGSAVSRLARSLCGSSAAEDVVQDVFFKLWSNPQRYDPARGSLRALLMTMTHHRAVDYVRSSESSRRREERWLSSPDPLPSDVERQIMDDDLSRRILAAIDALPPREKAAIMTTYYGRCTYREAAIVLGESEGTVKSRIRSGLTRLATALSDATSAAPS